MPPDPTPPTPAPPFAGTIAYHEEATSTQELARAQPQAPHGHAFVARRQSSGRGRSGRRWVSDHHLGLWLTCVLRPPPRDDLTTLPLLVGLSARAALAALGYRSALKWPNDLLLGAAKVGGILVEADFPDGAPRLRAGIGINIGLPAGLPAGGLPPAALAPALVADDPAAAEALRRALAEAVVAHLAADTERWHSRGWPAFAQAYAAADALAGHPVRARLPGGEVLTGQAAGVDGAGRLLLETPRGRRALTAGDVEQARPLPRC